jgi:hypothetical protein
MMAAASAIEHRTRREPAAGPRRLVGCVHLLVNWLNISLNSFKSVTAITKSFRNKLLLV